MKRTFLLLIVLLLLLAAGCATMQTDLNDAGAYNKRGVAYARKGQYDQAISDFNKALEINPRYATAYYNRGVAYARKGQYDQAISDFTKALEINPRYATAYYNRGLPIRIRANMTKPGRMCIRHKIWGTRSLLDFSRIFVKLQEDRNRSKRSRGLT